MYQISSKQCIPPLIQILKAESNSNGRADPNKAGSGVLPQKADSIRSQAGVSVEGAIEHIPYIRRPII